MPVNLKKVLEGCRLCQLHRGTIEIIGNDEFISQVFECTKVKINDERMHYLPKTICLSCKINIQEFYSFIKEVQLVDQKLHSQFSHCSQPETASPNRALTKEHSKKNDGRFKCPVCPKTYARLQNLQIHQRIHTNLHCSVCKITFDDTESRKNHMCVSSNCASADIQENSIPDCAQGRLDKLESVIDSVISNSRILGEENFKKDCKREWFEEDEVSGEPEEGRGKIKPENSSDDGFNQHRNNNEVAFEAEATAKKKSKEVGTSFTCTYENCSKLCTSAYTLRTHLMRHEGNTPFLCVTCGKGFTTKNSLNCHEKIHAKVKPYECKECNIGFSVASNLRAHQKKHHEGVRFYCSQCTRAFITKCSLERHELVHTGIKEFKCETCQAEFYTNKELLKHQRYHQGLRLYKCEECFKTFFEKHHLTIHIRVHTGERPYACKVAGCGKRFAESQKLSRHMKARHPPV